VVFSCPFIISALILTLIPLLLGYLWPAALFAVILIFFLLFFRDPERAVAVVVSSSNVIRVFKGGREIYRVNAV